MAKQAQLVLGTAQIGMRYGIANKAVFPTEAKALALIREAIDAGITTIDTARAYGLGEARIGQALSGAHGVTIVTKLDPLDQIAADALAETAVAATASVTASRAALKCDRLDVVLLHRAEHVPHGVVPSGATSAICRRRHASARLASLCKRPRNARFLA
jgi:aryl-alcohol dehydrogenase-like predicted oxidoreductase